MIRLRVYGDPASQGSMRVINGRAIHDSGSAVRRWRECITVRALQEIREPIDEPVWIRAVFWLPRPKHPRFVVPATALDLDKLTRALGDGLSPKAGRKPIVNDSRICGWDVEKRWADRESDPGVYIEIRKEHER